MMLLDEPTAGMAHEDVERITALIKRVAANRTVLMVEHNLSRRVDAVATHHGARARRDPRRRRLRDGVAQPARDGGVPGQRMPDACAERCSAGAATCRPGTASRTSCTASTSTCARARWSRLLGRNGAGKTTTLKSIMGMVPRREGSIAFDGAETMRLPSNRIARLGIACCPEERGIFASLNVEENLLLPPQVRDGRAGARADLRAVSQPARAAREPGHQALRRRAADAGDRRASCAPARGCCCWTSRPRASRPVIVQQIGRTIARLKTRRLHDPAGRAEFPLRRDRRRPALRDGARPHRGHDRRTPSSTRNMAKLHEYLGV